MPVEKFSNSSESIFPEPACDGHFESLAHDGDTDSNNQHSAPSRDRASPEPQPAPAEVPADPIFIELCAGSARVTSALQYFGLDSSFGVDHKRQKNAGRLLVADLTTTDGQNLVWTWLSSPNCMGVFAAPPCGTCSKARGIPVKLPSGKMVPGPKPLRTELQPDGVDQMSQTDRLRVISANMLYSFVTEVALFCLSKNLVICIENPRSSLYWQTSFFAPLSGKLTFTIHQACAYGSNRPKWTALAHNTSTLCQLCDICPGVSMNHKHKPWGLSTGTHKFSTSEETAYPFKLAFHIGFFLAQHVVSLGWKPPASELHLPEEFSYQHLRAVTGIQPKASKLPQRSPNLVPSFPLLYPVTPIPQFCLVKNWKKLGVTFLQAHAY